MTTMERIVLVRRLGVVVVVMTVGLMILGSWVKATGSGLSCPDWPQCYGQWLPPFPSAETGGIDPDGPDAADSYTQAQVLYEWSHRLVASLLGIPLLAFAWYAFQGRDHHPLLRRLPLVALFILVIQVGLGGITVLGRNAAPLTTAHLATATLFLVTITMAAMVAWLQPLTAATPRTEPARQTPGAPAPKRTRRKKHELFPGEDPY